METAELIAWVVFALIFVWLGMVLGATWRQIEGEAERAGVVRPRRFRSRRFKARWDDLRSPRDVRLDRARAREARRRRRRPE